MKIVDWHTSSMASVLFILSSFFVCNIAVIFAVNEKIQGEKSNTINSGVLSGCKFEFNFGKLWQLDLFNGFFSCPNQDSDSLSQLDIGNIKTGDGSKINQIIEIVASNGLSKTRIGNIDVGEQAEISQIILRSQKNSIKS
jgi:hypothetical protein